MRGYVTILGRVDPWDVRWRTEIEIGVILAPSRKDIGERVEVDEMGFFKCSIAARADLKELLLKGDIAVAAFQKDGGHLIGLSVIKPAKLEPPIALRLPILRTKFEVASNDLISAGAIQRIAAQVARLQDVETRKARVPKTIANAIRELNSAARLAAKVISGERGALNGFRDLMDAGAIYHPGGIPGDFNGGETLLMAMSSELGHPLPSRPCGPFVDQALNVIDTGLRADLTNGRNDGYYVRQARAFVQSRLDSIVRYSQSVARDVRQGRLTGPGGGDDRTTEPLLSEEPAFDGGRRLPQDETRPDIGGEPPIDPAGFEGIPGSDFCQQVLDLCLGMYEAASAASEGDSLLDLIGAVDPDCLCHGQFDPSRIYTATPAPGRDFSIAINLATGKLRPDVVLFVRNKAITPTSVSLHEIEFQLQDIELFHSGFVYLRRLGPTLSMRTQQLARVCGRILPSIPTGILFDPSPKALISVVYPPVIEFFSASVNGISGPTIDAEGCKDVTLRWHATLLDLIGSNLPLPPCAQLDILLRDDSTGQPIPSALCLNANGNPDGTGDQCAIVSASNTRAYTLQVTSRALAVCGMASAQVTVNRTNYLNFEYHEPSGQADGYGLPVKSGDDGSFDLVFSCPAEQAFQVDLLSSDPQVLQVVSPVIVNAGEQRVQVQFTTTADTCATIAIDALAPPGNQPYAPQGSLIYDVYRAPVLHWAAGSPPAQIFEDVPFTAEVETDCVPAEQQFGVVWSVTPPDGAPVVLSAAAVTTLGTNRFWIAFPGLSPANANPPWQLNIVIPRRNNAGAAQGLALAVLPRPTFLVDVNPSERVVIWGNVIDYNVSVTPQNFFVGDVTLALPPELLLIGAEPRFLTAGGAPLSMNTVTLVPGLMGANGPSQQVTLRVATSEGATKLGRKPFLIVGTGQAAGLPPPPVVASAPATLRVNRSPGALNHFYMLPNGVVGSIPFESTSCNGSFSSRYAVGQGGSNEVTFFAGSDPNARTVIGSPHTAIFYLLSRKCRVGLIFDGTPPNFTARWYNLNFSTTTDAPTLGGLIENVGPGTWQQIWFSQDDSLLLAFSIQGNSTGPAPTYAADLYDTITGDRLAHNTFVALTVYPRMVLERARVLNIQANNNQSSSQDPFGREPTDGVTNLPPAIADVYSAVLNAAGDRVSVTFRRYVPEGDPSISMGVPDTPDDLMNGRNNFMSFDLMLP
jgi:hypothetical protein